MANYIGIIGEFFPTTEAYIATTGNPTVYADIRWITAPIAQATLDSYAAQVNNTVTCALTANVNSIQNYDLLMYSATDA